MLVIYFSTNEYFANQRRLKICYSYFTIVEVETQTILSICSETTNIISKAKVLRKNYSAKFSMEKFNNGYEEKIKDIGF